MVYSKLSTYVACLKLDITIQEPEDHWSCRSPESIHTQHSRVSNSKANCTIWPNVEFSREFYISKFDQVSIQNNGVGIYALNASNSRRNVQHSQISYLTDCLCLFWLSASLISSNKQEIPLNAMSCLKWRHS